MAKVKIMGLLAFIAGSVASLSASENTASESTSVIFSSKEALEKAMEPLNVEEVVARIGASTALKKLSFALDPSIKTEKRTPLRHPGVGNLLKTEVYRAGAVTVFYPETPRVPHHLAIAFNRKDIKGLASISEEENAELFATIKKIAEIYKTISIGGFVIAQFDAPQEGHLGRCVVEIIPHLPGFKDVKNIVDKMDCNRHVLFRKANLSPVFYPIKNEEILEQAQFWQMAFQEKHPPLTEKETRIVFPYTRRESHQLEAEEILYKQLLEIFQDKGANVLSPPSFTAVMPTQVPETVKEITVTKCAFCDDAVVDRQLVYEVEDVAVFYNMRKGAKAGSCFLVLPKRHTEKVYGLNASETRNISMVRKALTEVLKETHPECEVIVYTQDDPAIGQTVFHSHEQVVAVDPQTIALTWSLMSLYPSGNVSNEEMAQIRKEFGMKLEQKIKEMSTLAKTA